MARRFLPAIILALNCFMAAQELTVRGKVNVFHPAKNGPGSSNVVVWLTPSGENIAVSPGPSVRLLQKNKQFTPHILAVTVGTTIEFPNQDPFFHDVFSIYRGKPFDLGLYESGAVRKVLFSKPGVSFIFCNIHPEMSGIVLVMRTPYFAITGADGTFQIVRVPAGRYKLEVWSQFASDSELESASQDVEISSEKNVIGMITLHSSDREKEHLNKYGEPYTPEKSISY
jgi:plastocyanin